MAVLCGEDKPLADMAIYQDIGTAPKDAPGIIGAWISKTGKLLGEEPIEFFSGVEAGFADDDCPANIEEWNGWCGLMGSVVFPSHWRVV